MTHNRIRPVVLAGGSGTRLWPVSRSLFPKQFAALTSDLSLFEQTPRRCASLGLADPILTARTMQRTPVDFAARGIWLDANALETL